MNEVEGAGNTPLHNAAWDGWAEGVELLIGLGAKVCVGCVWKISKLQYYCRGWLRSPPAPGQSVELLIGLGATPIPGQRQQQRG